MSHLLPARPLLLVTGAVASFAVVAAAAAPAEAVTPTALTAAVTAPVVTLPIGDGLNDAETLTVTAAAATTADITLQRGADAPIALRTGLPLAAGTTPVSIDATALPAGTYAVRVSSVDGGTAGTTFTVGSGDATALSVAAGASSLYPAAEASRQVRVTAVDETGTALPLTGGVALRAGSATRTAQLGWVAGANLATVPTSGLQPGDAALVVSATTPAGRALTATTALRLLASNVTSIAVSRSTATVYPVKDGYRDSVVFAVTPRTAGPMTTRVTGSAKLTGHGRTVKTWALHAGTNRLTWNGRTGSRVVAGSYRLTVTAKGPNGASASARSSVTVSPKRLETRTTTVTRSGPGVLSRYQTFDADHQGDCRKSAAIVGCIGYDAYYDDTLSLVAAGTTAVPKVVRSSTAYGKPSVRIAVHTRSVSGQAAWSYAAGGSSTAAKLAVGTRSGKWISWSGNPSTVVVAVGLGEYSYFFVDSFTMTYRYRALV